MSSSEWLAVRAHLQRHRYQLAVEAAGHYPALARVAGTPLLTRRQWLPSRPLDLDEIDLAWLEAPEPVVTGDTGEPSYSQLMREWAAPRVFENRSTYRLGDADLAGPPRLGFGVGSYFDGIDVGEAAAHEFAARSMASEPTPLRDAVGDPCDLSRRPANLAVSCLTIRRDERSSFLLHWRDPAKVGHAGGLYQVIPVGVFQSASEAPGNRDNDFSLWRCLVRESAEELLGADEEHAEGGAPIDYDAWPLAVRMTSARRSGALRTYCLGMGVDPLTFATDLLVVMVVDADVYDDLFAATVATNAEGRSLTAAEGAGGDGRITFDEESVRHFSGVAPMQAAGAAVLRLAWHHRAVLLAHSNR